MEGDKHFAQHHGGSRPHRRSVADIPVYADFPRQLIIYEERSGKWIPTTDEKVIKATRYLAVSYCQRDFPDKEQLLRSVRSVCERANIRAYWIDFACLGQTKEEKNIDLYRIADVFRFAEETVIMIKGGSDNADTADSEEWRSWGDRVWTFPEALLSKVHTCKVGERFVRETNLKQIANYAFTKRDKERELINIYQSGGRDFLQFPDRLELLCSAIWSRAYSPDHTYPGIRVYALMGFLLRRIQPRPEESESDAFGRLMDANGLEFDHCPADAYVMNEMGALGIRRKGEHRYILPEAVGAAEYDYGSSGRSSCLQDTRLRTLSTIYDWLGLGKSDPTSFRVRGGQRVFWMKGLAGSGKSTIAQTVAEKCKEHNILGASFFCSRSTPDLCNVLNIFPSIAYQLSRLNIDIKRRLSEVYGNDNTLLQKQPETQLRELIVKPLGAIKHRQIYVIIIDGLDECRDEGSKSVILNALDKHNLRLEPLKFFVTSRPEPNITGAFYTLSLNLDTSTYDLSMEDKKQTDADVRRFLEKGLFDLAFLRGLAMPWPTSSELDTLVTLANGLFIFASTTIKFLGDPSVSNAKMQLNTLLNSTSPVSPTSPYMHLDLLYLQVLKNAFNEMSDAFALRLKSVLLVLSRGPFTVAELGSLLGMESDLVRETLNGLRSLIVIPDEDTEGKTQITLIHPSISDFLLDENRCTDGRFVMNDATTHSYIARNCIRILTTFTSMNLASSRLRVLLLRFWNATFDYSIKYWIHHINNSDLDDKLLSALSNILSNDSAISLITRNTKESIENFLDIAAELSKRPTQNMRLHRLLYQNLMLLLGKCWFDDPDNFISYYLSNVANESIILHGKLQFELGMYELNGFLNAVLCYIQSFESKNMIQGLNEQLLLLKRKARDLHNTMVKTGIPADESLRMDMSLLFVRLYLDFSTGAKMINKPSTNSNYANLTRSLSLWLQSICVAQELLDFIFNGSYRRNLDCLYIQTICESFPELDEATIRVLRVIFSTLFMTTGFLQEADIIGLISLHDLPTDRLDYIIARLRIYINRGSNGAICLNHHSVLQAFRVDEVKSADARFTFSRSLEQSETAVLCVRKLIQFLPDSDFDDAALRYARENWLNHIQSSINATNDSCRLFEEYFSKTGVPDLVEAESFGHGSLYYIIFLSTQGSLPAKFMVSLYNFTIRACVGLWVPKSLKDLKPKNMKIFTLLVEARKTLCDRYSYKDGLYNLDVDPPSLQMFILKLAYSSFNVQETTLETERIAKELRALANGVHQILMDFPAPEEESACLELKSILSGLNKELHEIFQTSCKSSWVSSKHGVDGNAISQAKPINKALQDFRIALESFKYQITRFRKTGILNAIDPQIGRSNTPHIIPQKRPPTPDSFEMRKVRRKSM